MSERVDNPGPSAAAPDVVVERRHGLPLVWLIPMVATVIAAWLAYTTYSKQGPTIVITFDDAGGLEPGKTQVKYRDVTLGVVKDVALSADLSHVIVTAEMEKSATDHLREGTQFWIESARVGASGISGLGTLVSGSYIGVLPGQGEPAREFVGIEDPPVLQVTVPGRRVTLHADRLGSIPNGSPIYFRGIEVGQVLGSELAPDNTDVRIYAFVPAPHDALIRAETRFWNASGIDVSLTAKGLAVRTGSMVSVLIGGIAFDTPIDASAGPPVEDGTHFPLYASYDGIQEAQYTQKVPYLLYFQGSVSGLEPGAPVLFNGMQLGVVESVRLEIDLTDYSVRVPVVIRIEPQRATVVGATTETTPQQRMGQFVARGLRGQLRSGNLLTGSLVVALDFFREEPAAQLTHEHGYAVIPTVESEVERLTEKASAFLSKLAAAPVAELVGDLRKTVQDVDTLLASKSVHQAVDGLREVGPLLDSLKRTSDAARTTLEVADGVISPDSALRYDLVKLLNELTGMARSVRTLADYLERNPNTLIFGKPTSGGQ